MIPSTQINSPELDSFRAANFLLKNPIQSNLGRSFEEVYEDKAKESAKKIKDKATEISDDTSSPNKKKATEKQNDRLPDITQVLNGSARKSSHELQSTYALLERFKERRNSQEDDLSRGARQLALNNAHSFAGQPLIQPIYDNAPRKRMTKEEFLGKWEKFAPSVTEDIAKKSVRIDIPTLTDVHALVLRLNPDRSITASLLGSQAMAKLVKENQDQLDKNLRHHQLSLKEFNTYSSELEFNSESGTRKKKKQAKSAKKTVLDLI